MHMHGLCLTGQPLASKDQKQLLEPTDWSHVLVHVCSKGATLPQDAHYLQGLPLGCNQGAVAGSCVSGAEGPSFSPKSGVEKEDEMESSLLHLLTCRGWNRQCRIQDLPRSKDKNSPWQGSDFHAKGHDRSNRSRPFPDSSVCWKCQFKMHPPWPYPSLLCSLPSVGSDHTGERNDTRCPHALLKAAVGIQVSNWETGSYFLLLLFRKPGPC